MLSQDKTTIYVRAHKELRATEFRTKYEWKEGSVWHSFYVWWDEIDAMWVSFDWILYRGLEMSERLITEYVVHNLDQIIAAATDAEKLRELEPIPGVGSHKIRKPGSQRPVSPPKPPPPRY